MTLIRAVVQAVLFGIQALSLVLIACFAAAWFLRPGHKISRFIDRALRRPLDPLRRLLLRLPLRLPVDLSPVLAMLILQPVRMALLWVLWKLP